MKKRFNWLGFTGLVMLLLGAAIFRSRGALIPWFLSWILGPLLWYVGGALAIASLIQRIFASSEPPETAVRAQREAAVTTNSKETPLTMKAHVIAAIAVVALSASFAQGAAADGQAVFTAKCQMCHGADGAGKTPMGAKLNIADLRSDAVQKLTDADIAKVVAAGKNKMTGYEGKLSKQQIADVAAYVHELKKK